MTMASLTASLLARKGSAEPSTRNQDIIMPTQSRASQQWEYPRKTASEDARPTVKNKPATEQSCSPQTNGAEQRSPHSQFVSKEARHTRLVQSNEVAPNNCSRAKMTNRKNKTLRLDQDTDLQLRLLAARKGTSQQALMEKALKRLLRSEARKNDCICISKI